jgi:hypothetical protein
MAFIEQRVLGKAFHSQSEGLLDVLRQAPDVIVVGEMRAPETIQLSLDAAESGHLVIATMHAGTHEEAVNRMCSLSTLAGEHIRLQLAQSLAGIVNQHLLYMPRLKHSVPLLSILRNTRAIATLIRENKLSQLDSTLETCKAKGMFTFAAYRDDYLAARTEFRQPQVLHATAPATPRASIPRACSTTIIAPVLAQRHIHRGARSRTSRRPCSTAGQRRLHFGTGTPLIVTWLRAAIFSQPVARKSSVTEETNENWNWPRHERAMRGEMAGGFGTAECRSGLYTPWLFARPCLRLAFAPLFPSITASGPCSSCSWHPSALSRCSAAFGPACWPRRFAPWASTCRPYPRKAVSPLWPGTTCSNGWRSFSVACSSAS